FPRNRPSLLACGENGRKAEGSAQSLGRSIKMGLTLAAVDGRIRRFGRSSCDPAKHYLGARKRQLCSQSVANRSENRRQPKMVADSPLLLTPYSANKIRRRQTIAENALNALWIWGLRVQVPSSTLRI